MKFALRADIIRKKWPPKGGWIYHESATGWTAPTPMSDNFDSTVDKIRKHRAANRGYNLSINQADIEADLMQQVAQRILQNAPEHIEAWIVPMDDEAKKKSNFPQASRRAPGAAPVRAAGPSVVERILSRIRSISRGAATLADWVGDGAVPVSPIVANRRGNICVGCPMNRPTEDFSEVITGSIAEAISAQTIVKNAIGVTSSVEDKLGVCDACGCHLRLKVWVPIKTIRGRTDQETMDALHPACWVKNETVTASASGGNSPNPSRIVTIRRRAAFGDVIMATILATKLREIGIGTKFITEPVISAALNGHPDVVEWASDGAEEVNLDRTYEDNLERDRKDIPLLMLEASVHQLKPLGIELPNLANRVPVLGLSDTERWEAAKQLETLERPRIVLVDASGSWANRSWSRKQVEAFPSRLNGFGTVIWSKPDRWVGPPNGVASITVENFRHLMAIISQADLVVTPDTGPMHVAAAFNKPIVVLEQCNKTSLRLSNLTDWSTVSASLDCIGCSQFKCPINEKIPPCQEIDAAMVAALVRLKWQAYNDSDVSVLIPVLNESPRLERCVEAVIGQAKEVIVVLDGKGSVSQRIRGMGVRVIPSTGERIGYGKSMMRAARTASHRFLLMLNDDCYMDPGSVAKMKMVMQPSVGVVGALLRYPDGRIQHGGQYRPPGVIGFGHIDHGKRTPTFTDATDMESVTFASALVRREALFGVRGFDEVYDCYSEDTDLCLKLGAAGWRVVYQPAATGIHDESQSTTPTKDKMLRESSAIFGAKWKQFLSSRRPLI